MLPGETIHSGGSPVCCGNALHLHIMESPAGYYLGTECPECGPYSRESHYYPTHEALERAIETDTVNWR